MIHAFIYYRDSITGVKELEGFEDHNPFEYYLEIENCVEIHSKENEGFYFEAKPAVGDVLPFGFLNNLVNHPKGSEYHWEDIDCYIEKIEWIFLSEQKKIFTNGIRIIISKENPFAIKL